MSTLKFKNPETGEWEKVGIPVADGMKMELLWENASPTSTFSAQTISVNYSDYDLLMFIVAPHTSTDGGFRSPARTIGGLIEPSVETTGYLLGDTTSFIKRSYTLQQNGIAFGEGNYASTYGNKDYGGSSNSCIPIKIYGIKGVQ